MDQVALRMEAKRHDGLGARRHERARATSYRGDGDPEIGRELTDVLPRAARGRRGAAPVLRPRHAGSTAHRRGRQLINDESAATRLLRERQPEGDRGAHPRDPRLVREAARDRLAAHVTGSLVVVGTGIGAAQLTTEARAEIAGADEVFFLVGDPAERARRAARLAPNGALARRRATRTAAPRRDAYERDGRDDPRAGARGQARLRGLLRPPRHASSSPSREASRRARAEGLAARMLPRYLGPRLPVRRPRRRSGRSTAARPTRRATSSGGGPSSSRGPRSSSGRSASSARSSTPRRSSRRAAAS